MTKKLEQYAKEIASRFMTQFKVDDKYYAVSDHAAICLSEPIPDVHIINENDNVNLKNKGKNVKKFFEEFYTNDYESYNIPDLRKGIRETVGRKLDRVLLRVKENLPAINARYLRDATEALGMNNMFCVKDIKKPVFISKFPDYETVILILPVITSSDNVSRTGFWCPELEKEIEK